MSHLVGQQRGDYRLTQLLGQGGFAEVYLGEHIHLGWKVAIKVLYTRLNEEGLKQFKQEALTLTNLSHPHIIKVLNFSFDVTNTPYLVMEFAPGGTLSKRHPLNTPVPLPTVVGYVKQVADALHYAHTNKVIHRDIKPENMLIGQDHTILLSDFGIARVVETYGANTSHITGSFQYMAPEQGAANPVFASDQYSLGIVVYQWLCGTLPFHGSIQDLIIQQRFHAPPPFPSNLGISSSVENVVMKALSKDPQQRFTTVQEFATMLERTSRGEAVQVAQVAQPVSPQVNNQWNTVTFSPTQVPPTQSSSINDSDAFYRQGVEAYANGNLDGAEQAWEHVLSIDPNYGNGMLAPRMARLRQELQPIRIQRLREQAMARNKAAEWQQEIAAWTQLLAFAPRDEQALERRKLAEHNRQYAWMYSTAQQFVSEGKLDAAKAELNNLWHDAPYYSDPAGLARKVGLMEPIDYEKAKEEQKRQQERQAQEQQRQAQEQHRQRLEIEQALQKSNQNTQKKQMREEMIEDLGGNVFLIGLCLFMLIAGVGSLVGIIAGYWIQQTWVIATVTSFVLAVLAYALGYHKVIKPLGTLLSALPGIATTFAITWYTSQLQYGSSQVSHMWFIDRTLWIGRQFMFGMVIGFIAIVIFLGTSGFRVRRRIRY